MCDGGLAMTTPIAHKASLGARRISLCVRLVLLSLACASQLSSAADLSGYWTLDTKRSEAWAANLSLTAAARTRIQNFDPKKHDPTTVCMPYGMPRVMSALGAFPMEIVQTTAQVTMIFDAHDEVRRVFLAARRDDKAELAPLWLGYATGKWDGETLLVETIGITDQSLVSDAGIPHSGDLRVVERLRRLDANTLINEMTLHDARAFARPIARKLYYTRVPEIQQREFHCAEQQWLDHVMGRAKELTRQLVDKELAEKTP